MKKHCKFKRCDLISNSNSVQKSPTSKNARSQTRSVMKTTSSFCLLIQAFMNVMIRWWSRLLGFIQCLTFRTAVQDSENCGCLTWNITLVGSKMHFSVDGPRKKFERAYLGYLSYILEFRREPLPVRNSTRCLHLGTEN